MTDRERGELVSEKDPQKREAVVAKLTEDEAKDFILRLLRIMHGEERIKF